MTSEPLNGAPAPDDALAAMVAALPYLLSVKEQLLAQAALVVDDMPGTVVHRMVTTVRCPWCHAETCQVGIEPRKQHLRVHCSTCNRSLME